MLRLLAILPLLVVPTLWGLPTNFPEDFLEENYLEGWEEPQVACESEEEGILFPPVFWDGPYNTTIQNEDVTSEPEEQEEPQVACESEEEGILFAPVFWDGPYNTTIQNEHVTSEPEEQTYPATKEGIDKEEFQNGSEVEYKTVCPEERELSSDLSHNFTNPRDLEYVNLLAKQYNSTLADVITEILFEKNSNSFHPQKEEKNKKRYVMQHEYTMHDFNETEQRTPVCKTEYGFYPDPGGNCNVYYMCVDGRAIRRTCSTGLHFNPVTKLCDYKGKALCEIRCPLASGRFPVPGYCNTYLECSVGQPKFVICAGNLHFNALTKQCDDPTKAACEVSCPSYDTLVSLPGRCNMYARCEEGKVSYHLCPTGLHFNPILLRCDLPQHAECDTQKCPHPDGYFPVVGQCGTYIICQNNHLEVHYCPSNLHFNFLLRMCDKPSGAQCNITCKKPNGFFPFPGVCSHYIKCLRGTPFLEKCPGDQEFNAAVGQCDTVARKHHCLPNCLQSNGIFPVDNHCDMYIRCSDGRGMVKRCPGNLHFNALFKRCDTPERALCNLDCPYPSGMFPIPGRCNMFHRCDGGEVTVQTCPKGLHFNARTLTCDWPTAAMCEMTCPSFDGYFPIQGDCSAYVVCSAGQPNLKKCPAGKHFNFDLKRCDPPEIAKCELECPVENGLFPIPGHCDSYLRCEGQNPHLDTCAPGLFFNHFTQMCDLPDNVQC